MHAPPSVPAGEPHERLISDPPGARPRDPWPNRCSGPRHAGWSHALAHHGPSHPSPRILTAPLSHSRRLPPPDDLITPLSIRVKAATWASGAPGPASSGKFGRTRRQAGPSGNRRCVPVPPPSPPAALEGAPDPKPSRFLPRGFLRWLDGRSRHRHHRRQHPWLLAVRSERPAVFTSALCHDSRAGTARSAGRRQRRRRCCVRPGCSCARQSAR